MRFKTIWTMPSMRLRERLIHTRDWAAQEIGARLPVRVRYWVAMQEIGKATMDSPNVLDTNLSTIIKNLETPRNLS